MVRTWREKTLCSHSGSVALGLHADRHSSTLQGLYEYSDTSSQTSTQLEQLIYLLRVNGLEHFILTRSGSTTTTSRFTALFPEPPRWDWAGARRGLLDFIVQGKINRGRHTDHPAGRHSIRTNQCPPPPSPHFFTGRMSFLPPNQQCQSTEGN